MKRYSLIGWLACGLLAVGGWSARAAEPASASRQERLMNMPVAITVWARDATACAQALEAGFGEFRRIEQVFSAYRQGSTVNEINRAASRQPVKVSSEVMGVLTWAQNISRLTGGAFDITVASFGWEYGFGQGDYRVPTNLRLDQLKNVVNYRYVMLLPEDQTVLFKRDGVQIDLGGIAKSYALNRVRGLLERLDVTAALINAGGDVTVKGRKPGGGPWQVGVRHPRDPKRLLTVIPLESGKVLSSGDYERYFERDGVRYHHILDAKTGQPSRFAIAVTLRLPERPKVDLPSVALMLLPTDQALALVARIPGAEALIVDHEQKIWLTPGWQKTLKVEW